MKIFLAGTSLLPDYGGPAFSVSRLAIALAEAGAEVGLWASNQSAAITPLLPTESSVQRLTGTEAEPYAASAKLMFYTTTASGFRTTIALPSSR